MPYLARPLALPTAPPSPAALTHRRLSTHPHATTSTPKKRRFLASCTTPSETTTLPITKSGLAELPYSPRLFPTHPLFTPAKNPAEPPNPHESTTNPPSHPSLARFPLLYLNPRRLEPRPLRVPWILKRSVTHMRKKYAREYITRSSTAVVAIPGPLYEEARGPVGGWEQMC